jgi:membrane-associated phospholipid phosphatase
LLTYFAVISGADWRYFLFMRGLPDAMSIFLHSALVLGFFLPLLVPAFLYIYYFFTRSHKIFIFAKLLTFSAILGWFASSLIKVFTGRIQPNMYNLLIDNSHHFNFGLFKYGIFWGWPSSHTTVAFATSAALLVFLKHKHFHFSHLTRKIISFILIIYPCYIAIGVSVSAHWLSDVLIGIVLGVMIGRGIGKYYLSHHF